MSTAATRTLNPRGNFGDFGDFDDQRPLNESESTTAWIVFGCLTFALVVAYENMLRFTATYWSDDM